MKRIATNIAVLIATILIFLFFLELFLRRFYPQDLNVFKLDAQLEYKGVPNMKALFRTPEFNTTIKLNNKGLRDYSHEYFNANDNYRILFLGDSMTFGYGVENDETYAKILENLLNRNEENYETINAGVTGWNTCQELTFLKTEGLKYNPNLVVLGFMFNDVYTTYIYNCSLHKFSLSKKIRNFLSLNSHLYSFIKTKTGLKNRITEEKELMKEILIKTMLGIDDYRIDEGWEKTFSLLNEFRGLLAEKNISFMIVIIPTKEHVDDKELKEILQKNKIEESIDIDKPRDVLINFLKNEKIEYVDLTDDFRKENMANSFYYDYDSHLNKKGHEFAARLIYQKLVEEKIR